MTNRTTLGCPWSAAQVVACSLLLQLLTSVQAGHELTFRVGLVAGSCNSVMEEAHLGFKLLADKTNDGTYPMSFADKQGAQHRLLFNYTRYDDSCEQQQHEDLLNTTINQDLAHFVLGASPEFALSDSISANNAQRLIYHCCLPTDSLYRRDMRHVFGIQSSNMLYPIEALKAMALGGGLKRLYIFSLANELLLSTCQAAADFAAISLALDPGFRLVRFTKYTRQNATAHPELYEKIVEEAVSLEADAVMGCDSKEAGISMAKLFRSSKHKLKALWLSEAPSDPQFYSESDGPAFENVLSVAQWQPDVAFNDSLFGSAATYSRAFEGVYGKRPADNAASASATLLSLGKAISEAFEGCELPDPGLDADSLLFDKTAIKCQNALGMPVISNGYVWLQHILAQQRLDTFFGKVEFNRFRRNVAKGPVTLQVQSGKLEVVLPLEVAKKNLIMPMPLSEVHDASQAQQPATIGSLYKETFIAVVVAVVGFALLVSLTAFWAFQWNRRKGRDIDSKMLSGQMVISEDELVIINLPMWRSDGTFESGTAQYKGTVVALDPLCDISVEGLHTVHLDPSNHSRHPASGIGPSSFGSLEDVEDSAHAGSLMSGHLDQHEAIALAAKVQNADKSCASSSMPVPHLTPHSSAHKGGRKGVKRNWTTSSFFHSLEAAAFSPGAPQPLGFHSPQPFHSPSIAENPSNAAKNPGSVASAPHAPFLLSKNQVLKLLWRCKCLQHPNIVPVIGIVWTLSSMNPQMPIIVRECQELGPVSSVLENQTMVLDTVKQMDISKDVAQALAVIHAQGDFVPKPVLQPRLHGVLLNKFCRAKVWVPLSALSDVVLPNAKRQAARLYSQPPPLFPFPLDYEPDEDHSPEPPHSIEELEDVQRYGIGMAQLLTTGSHAEGHVGEVESKASQHLLEDSLLPQDHFFSLLAEHGPAMAQLLAHCCSKDSDSRPPFVQILLQLEAKGAEIIQAANEFLRTKAQGKSLQSLALADELLYDLFPEKVAEALKSGRLPDPEPFPLVSLFFSDVCGYTNICSLLEPPEVMNMLHRLYSRFDELTRSLKLFKVETVGDAYMCVANLKHPQPEYHARIMAQFAFSCIAAANGEVICPSKPELGNIHIRVGLHAGPVMGAVVGTLNRRFGLFGDTVNVASRMESTCPAPDHVHCSAAFYKLLQEQWPESAAQAVPQGPKEIKGKGRMHTYMIYPAVQVEQARRDSRPSNPSLSSLQQLAQMSKLKSLSMSLGQQEGNVSTERKLRRLSSLAS